MDIEIENKINEILSSIRGEKTKNTSFASEKNTNVNNVQFVIKIAAIEKKEIKVKEKKQTKSKSLWQKFIQLFDF